jgi:heteromeric Ino2p/Ino4p transcription factor
MAKAAPVPPSESSPSSSIQSDGPTSPRDTTPNKKGKSSRKMLTETQKNSNHKEAENKRRNMIRDQFTRLSHIVPGAEGRERSELVMLELTLSHFKAQVEESRMLAAEIEKRGGHVDESLKLRRDDWGGDKWRGKNLEDANAHIARRNTAAANGNGNGKAAAKDEEDD